MGMYNRVLSINLMSPERVRELSRGVVTESETVTCASKKHAYKIVPGGLFCERIFGAEKIDACGCDNLRGQQWRGKICSHCGVEVTGDQYIRRERMGRIELACPVVHPWFYTGTTSKIATYLGLKKKDVDAVISYNAYIVTYSDVDKVSVGRIMEYKEYVLVKERYDDSVIAKQGAEGLEALIKSTPIEELYERVKEELEETCKSKQAPVRRRLLLLKQFMDSGNKPEWMIMHNLLVIPPDLRPIAQLENGTRMAKSGLNTLYANIISRNKVLAALEDVHAPYAIICNEKRLLQQAVDALIQNEKMKNPVRTSAASKTPLKSLSAMLSGKQGQLRQNALGKRVDYSGRSVIAVNPQLKLDQCGLPKEMAVELFKPFVVAELIKQGVVATIKQGNHMIAEGTDVRIWDALAEAMRGRCVLLNRAPTLHKLGVQAFHPVIVEGHAMHLHPLTCTAFNADFDGDQMAVHLPLSDKAQAEAENTMLATRNLLKPADGKCVTVPTQDMILGMYWLTLDKEGQKGEGRVFGSEEEVGLAFEEKQITLHSKVRLRRKVVVNGEERSVIVPVTWGKLLFNAVIPQDLGFVDRGIESNAGLLEIDFKVTKKKIGEILDRCIEKHGFEGTVPVLDAVKSLGYHYSTISGITVAISDVTTPEDKADILSAAEEHILSLRGYYNRGFLTESERKTAMLSVWSKATEDVACSLEKHLEPFNDINMMADSGARGSMAQLKQLAGMRGLLANASGETIEIPIKSNFHEGLNVLEYFISCRGARKGMTDTALRTADAGYLTRRLVDVAQDVIIKTDDCGVGRGMKVSAITDGNNVIEPLAERLTGRYLVTPLIVDDKLIKDTDTFITASEAKAIEGLGVDEVEIRTPLTCTCKNGVCAKCYGTSLATKKTVEIGSAVGITAAQSIGEPGTQLTLRTFHTGGIAAGEDITTQGLPRVKELIDNKKALKRRAILSPIEGTVTFATIKDKPCIVVKSDDKSVKDFKYIIKHDDRLVRGIEGTKIKRGTALTEGSAIPSDVFEVLGEEATWAYMINEIQKVYRTQGVDINDKHIEIITRQMMNRVEILTTGSIPTLSVGMLLARPTLGRLIEVAQKQQGDAFEMPTYKVLVQGVIKVAVNSDSFLSSASFQNTVQVLTDAAIKGSKDHLSGLKENVIAGTLIPAGTGYLGA